MRCGQTREYLFAFLDNELDAPLSIELQRHIDGCADCAREAEIERTVRKHLAGALETDTPPMPEIGNSEFRIENSEFRSRRRWYLAAAAMALLFGAGIWFATDKRSATPRFVDLLVTDFEHYLDEDKQPQIASSEHDAVAKWLAAKTMIAVLLPAPRDPEIKLVGGRKCTLDGRPAAFAVYDLNGIPASWVAVSGDVHRLDGMNEFHVGGESYWVGVKSGYTVVARPNHGQVCAVVSALPKEQLLSLVLGAVHESD